MTRRSCPGFINRPWRVRKEYLVYSYGSQQGGEVDRASSRPLSVNKQRHGNIHHGNGSSMKKTTNADLRSKRVSHNGSHYNVPTEATQQTTTTTSSNNDADEIDCLSAFHAVYHELQLVRSVRRSRDLVQQNTDSKTTQEVNFLFLGDVHPQLEQRASYRPTSYQPPLIRHHHEVGTFFQTINGTLKERDCILGMTIQRGPRIIVKKKIKKTKKTNE